MSVDGDAIVSGTIAAAMTRLGQSPDHPAERRAIGVGWATVDGDRAEHAFGLGFRFESADPDVALGASCRVTTRRDGVALVVLEPATEGRLAESLGRFDEGPVAVWFATPSTPEPPGDAATAGPFGPERLVAGSPSVGWYIFLVDPPGTDDRRSPA